MHDFLLAKEIVDTTLVKAKENNIEKVSEIQVEIGTITMAHDGFHEHVEDISVDNLRCGLESISKGTILEGADFKISKIEGDHWKLVSLR